MDPKPQKTEQAPSRVHIIQGGDYLPLPHPMYIVYGTPSRPYDMKFSDTTGSTRLRRIKNAICWTLFWRRMKRRLRD